MEIALPENSRDVKYSRGISEIEILLQILLTLTSDCIEFGASIPANIKEMMCICVDVHPASEKFRYIKRCFCIIHVIY
jgi:hypothetical protein